MLTIIAFLSAFLLSLVMLGLAWQLGQRFGLVDQPGGRKTHDQATPVIGGIAMFLGFASLIWWLGNAWPLPILIGMTLITLLGLLDDIYHLSAHFRLLFQALIVFLSFKEAGVGIYELGDIFGNGSVSLGWATWPFTVLCICGLINAINMIDGIDGLAGGVSAVVILLITLVRILSGEVLGVERYLLLGVVLAFLVVNARYPGHSKASLFMGDGGSYFLGYALAYMVWRVGQGPSQIISNSHFDSLTRFLASG